MDLDWHKIFNSQQKNGGSNDKDKDKDKDK